MFDVSHMGQLKIYGKDRYRLLNKIQTGDVEKLGYNKSFLSLMLSEEAGIIDDTIVTHC
jgi:aminomethyltransferase